MSSGKRRALISIALIIAIVYVVIGLATDARRLEQALLQLGVSGCLGVLGLSVVNYLLRFVRWQHYLARLGCVLPFLRHFTYYLAGFAFTVSPAKAGEAVRSLYLREHGVTYSESIAALFVERLLDLCSMVLLASLIVVDHIEYRPLLVGVFALTVIAVTMVCLPVVPRWMDAYGARNRGRPARMAAGFANLLRSSRKLLRPQPLVFGTIVGLAAWGAEGVGFYVVCHTLRIAVDPGVAIGIYAVSALAGSAVFFLPAGIGGMEIVMSTLLVGQGATLRVAIIATLLCRLATLWFAVLLGIACAMGIEFSHHEKRIRTAP